MSKGRTAFVIRAWGTPFHLLAAARHAATSAARTHSARATPSRFAASSTRPTSRGDALTCNVTVALSLSVLGIAPLRIVHVSPTC